MNKELSTPTTRTLESIEAQSMALEPKAPRITLDYMRSQIACVQFTTGADLRDVVWYETDKALAGKLAAQQQLLTLCLVTFKNGFTIVGHAAPMSPDNFNAQRGRDLAYEKCIQQAWPLFAFGQLQAASDAPTQAAAA